MKEALALVGGARRRLSAREEELLGLLARFPDGGDGGDSDDRELSFSDLVEAGASNRPPIADDAEPDLGGAPTPPRDDRPTATSKKQRQLQAARQRARRSGGGSRGSCGGDGVLLNFYVPGLLTRSMTTPRPSRGPLPSLGAVHGAPAKPVTATAAAGKASRTQTALGIGCWPALWGRGRRTAKACS